MVDETSEALADRLEGLSESDWYLGKDKLLLLPKDMRTEIIAALRERDRMAEALEPFAAVRVPAELRHHKMTITDDRIVSVEMPFAPHEQKVDPINGGKTLGLCLSLDGLTVGDLRRARLALEAKEQGDG